MTGYLPTAAGAVQQSIAPASIAGSPSANSTVAAVPDSVAAAGLDYVPAIPTVWTRTRRCRCSTTSATSSIRPTGKHKIHFEISAPNMGFSQDNTYKLTVVKNGKSAP